MKWVPKYSGRSAGWKIAPPRPPPWSFATWNFTPAFFVTLIRLQASGHNAESHRDEMTGDHLAGRRKATATNARQRNGASRGPENWREALARSFEYFPMQKDIPHQKSRFSTCRASDICQFINFCSLCQKHTCHNTTTLKTQQNLLVVVLMISWIHAAWKERKTGDCQYS